MYPRRSKFKVVFLSAMITIAAWAVFYGKPPYMKHLHHSHCQQPPTEQSIEK
ncbi:MAG: hypothetical protein H6567_09585 [Lewinellaceae bacterium]|nr:hypothetical protein [Lewinellaceae bacterium]